MKISLALLLVLVLLLAGCVYQQAGQCNKLSPILITNIAINNSTDAFNTIQQFESVYVNYNTYENTPNATVDKLKYMKRTLLNGTTEDVWILNGDVAIDKDGNMFVDLGCI